MEKLHQQFESENFKILAVSIDSLGAKAVAPFMEKHNLSFQALIDPAGTIQTAYGINNILSQTSQFSILKGKIKFPYSEKIANYINIAITVLIVVYFLTIEWMPLGASNSTIVNFVFVVLIIAVVLGLLMSIVHF